MKNTNEVTASNQDPSAEPIVEIQSIPSSQAEVEIDLLTNQIPESILELEDGLKRVNVILTSLNNEVKSIGLKLKPASKSDPNTISGQIKKLTSNERRILKTKRSLVKNYIKKAKDAFDLLSSKLKLKTDQEQKKQQHLSLVINSKSPSYMKHNSARIMNKIYSILESTERSAPNDLYYKSLKINANDTEKFRKSFSDFLGRNKEDLRILASGSPFYQNRFSEDARKFIKDRHSKKIRKPKSKSGVRF